MAGTEQVSKLVEMFVPGIFEMLVNFGGDVGYLVQTLDFEFQKQRASHPEVCGSNTTRNIGLQMHQLRL
jgi:hypothetical protein